jgi:GTP 3',8-cyclase
VFRLPHLEGVTTIALTDRYGRTATDLRVSVTDRCNLRCSYCMPADGLPWLPGTAVLTDGELVRLITVAVTRLGGTDIRFTGGEPLLRPGLDGIVAAAAALTPRPSISLTTNGIGLTRHAAPLRAAGLDRVNISLDTLRPATFTTLTRRDRHADVLAGIAAAVDAGLLPVKLNTVLQRGVNDDEIGELVDFAVASGHELRFIEHMPLDAAHTWTRAGTVTADEILTRIRDRYHLTPAPGGRGGAPAETWLIDGHHRADGAPARVGVIASVTRPFCAACDRTRLTADGTIRSCLFSHTETDLRTPLRDGATDTDLARLWAGAMAGKGPGHGIDDVGFQQPERSMSAIGG